MTVYRITGKKHTGDLAGTGAGVYSGRWNKKETLVLYNSENTEIALLEPILHVPPLLVPDLVLLLGNS